jgi:2-oxoglutarate dehydrogenase E1 component
MIAMLDLIVESAGSFGVEEIVIGMAHRGRLNVLANIMGKNVREIFAQFEDKDAKRFLGGGDVKYHLGYSSNRVTTTGAKVHLSLAFNPSHLEFVNPVVEGRVRAKQDRGKRRHGHAAAHPRRCGVHRARRRARDAEPRTLEGYSTGGTVHLVVNNQIGFTTNPEDSRSTRYCTDITRMLKVPVFPRERRGSGGGHPGHASRDGIPAEVRRTSSSTCTATGVRPQRGGRAALHAAAHVRAHRQEADGARGLRQPARGVFAGDAATKRRGSPPRAGQRSNKVSRTHAKATIRSRPARWKGSGCLTSVGPRKRSRRFLRASTRRDFSRCSTSSRSSPRASDPTRRPRKFSSSGANASQRDGTLFWETAEALAFATLLDEGFPIRLSGQDSRRGTFSHRHAVLYDVETGEPYTPLAHVVDGARPSFAALRGLGQPPVRGRGPRVRVRLQPRHA